MGVFKMPAIDQNTCGAWTENQVDLYEKMPYYLGEFQADVKKTFPTWSKIVTKKRKWKANSGNTLRVIKRNASPHLRQFFKPRTIVSGRPNVDIMNVRESQEEAQVYSHQFESPHFSFLPSFTDFLDHIDENGKDIMEKIERANDLFLRGAIFHMAPFIGIMKDDGSIAIEKAPKWNGTDAFEDTVGKTEAFMKAKLAETTGAFSLSAMEMAMTIAENDLRIPFYTGSDLPKEDQGLDGKFLFVVNSEIWNNFIHDPWVKQNRPINLDLITGKLRGSFFGRATCMLEDLPLRYQAAGTYVEPELRASAEDEQDGETQPNPYYTDITNSDATKCSPYGVAFLCGKNNYEAIDVGPAPSLFAKGTPSGDKMVWNGQPRLTKNFNIPCPDSDGNIIWQANTYGKYIKFINETTFGIVPGQRRNIIPILYKRKRGA